MHISEVKTSRSICVNGEWDNAEFKMHLNEGDSLNAAQETLQQVSDEWESKIRAKRSLSPEETIASIQIDQKKEADLIASIYLAKTTKELETFKPFIENDNLATQAYNMMEKKLTTKTV